MRKELVMTENKQKETGLPFEPKPARNQSFSRLFLTPSTPAQPCLVFPEIVTAQREPDKATGEGTDKGERNKLRNQP
jgi:hypothetical protein